MKNKNELPEEIENIFKSKKDYHKDKSKLPIEEKIKILVKLQKMAIKANPVKNSNKQVWKI
ncbi:MAG: hypothetical protein WAT71_04090 [Ignavibacteria bacterium]